MNAIFISFNDNHYHFVNSFLNSIKHNYKNHPTILANYDGNNQRVIARLKETTNLRQIELNHTYGFNTGGIPSNIIFQRFNLWTHQFDEFDKILHLDVDMVILKSLDHIFEKEDFYIYSDHNPHAKIFSNSNDTYLLQSLKEDKIAICNTIDCMANAGVFLIPKKYRTNDYYQSLISLANKYHAYAAFADQSIISLWCHQSEIGIHVDFENNCQIRFLCDKNLRINVEKISILHFSGEAKYINKSTYQSGNLQSALDIYEAANAIRFFYRKPRFEIDELEELKTNLETAYKNHKHQKP